MTISDDTYHFDWSLEAHPENAESGTMEGKNTDTLKLSHVRIFAVITFKALGWRLKALTLLVSGADKKGI